MGKLWPSLAQLGLPETGLLLGQLLERHRFDLGYLDLTVGGLLALSKGLQLLGNAGHVEKRSRQSWRLSLEHLQNLLRAVHSYSAETWWLHETTCWHWVLAGCDPAVACLPYHETLPSAVILLPEN